jgi:hypothetical protein
VSETPSPTPAEIFKHWLKSRMDALMSVQASVAAPGNSVVVQTWTGVIINIYLFDTPVKTRAIKKVLHDSTEVGIGSMFIVDANMLPQANTRFEPDEWLLAIHALTHERVYGYTFDVQGPKLLQAHFDQINSNGHYGIHYGPPVDFDKLRVLRMSYKERIVKGDWHVADFGHQAFWKNGARSGYRPEYRRPDYREYAWRSWSNTSWEQNQTYDIPVPPRPARSKLEVWYELLEVNRDANREEVKAAFRKQAIIYHPDTSQLPKDEAATRFREITEAYEYIKTQRNWT